MNLTTFKLKKKMNLTIGFRSCRRVVPGVQVWVFWVRIRWRVRISVRFGRVGISSWEAWPGGSNGGCNSRLRVVTVTLTADLESTWNSGSYKVLSGMCGYPSTQVTGQVRSMSDSRRSSGLARSVGFEFWPETPKLVPGVPGALPHGENETQWFN